MNTCFNAEERRAFEVYCSALAHLAGIEFPTKLGQVDGFSGVVLRVEDCPSCKGPVPAGIPAQYKDTKHLACPRCVMSRGLTRHVLHTLNQAAPEVTPEQGFAAIRNAMAKIAERAHGPAKTPTRTPGALAARGNTSMFRTSRPSGGAPAKQAKPSGGIQAAVKRLEERLRTAKGAERAGVEKLLAKAREAAATAGGAA